MKLTKLKPVGNKIVNIELDYTVNSFLTVENTVWNDVLISVSHPILEAINNPLKDVIDDLLWENTLERISTYKT